MLEKTKYLGSELYKNLAPEVAEKWRSGFTFDLSKEVFDGKRVSLLSDCRRVK